MSLLKVNEVQNYNGSSLTLTASTVSTSAQLNTGGNVSVTGSLNVSDDSTTRSNLGLGSIATQDSSNVSVTGGSITGTTIVPTSPFSFRNKIINGNFDVWQRGTSQTSSGYGSADRWFLAHSGSSKTASQQSFTVGQTEVPNNPKYYLSQTVTSVTGAANYVVYFYRIEGVRTLAGKTATLSFYAKADTNKNIVTEGFQWFGAGGSPSSFTNFSPVTHNLTASWQKFTTTISIPSISGKTLGTNGGDYLQILFWFDAGTNWDSRTNSLGQQSGTFDIAQVQLEEGTVATPFEHRPIGVELSLCQRYCQAFKASEHTDGYRRYGNAIAIATTGYHAIVEFKTSMRSAPTLTKNSSFQLYNGGFVTSVADPSIGSANRENVLLTGTCTGATAGASYVLLSNNQNTSYLIFSSEL